MVNLNVRVLSRPRKAALKTIYETLGENYDDIVLPSIVNETCKQVVAQFNATQLLTQREQVSELIRRNLSLRAQEFNILMDDVALTEVRFGNEFMRAVEAKQVAQQESERARYIVEQAKHVRDQKIIRAEAEAKSIELIGRAMKGDPGYVQMKRLEAARDIASALQRGGNKMYLDGESLMLNILQGKEFDTNVKTK